MQRIPAAEIVIYYKLYHADCHADPSDVLAITERAMTCLQTVHSSALATAYHLSSRASSPRDTSSLRLHGTLDVALDAGAR